MKGNERNVKVETKVNENERKENKTKVNESK